MRLASIYNLFDGEELLQASINTIYKHVDLIVIVYQTISNKGEKCHYSEADFWIKDPDEKVMWVKYDTTVEWGAPMNERAKRNLGIDVARNKGCTHFLHMDVDEFYKNFDLAKQLYIESGYKGSVCRLLTYFKKPTFQFDIPEDYYVPFIHELNEDTKSGSSSYPFWVDPTRTVNQPNVIELPMYMHHYSWCRKDIMRKARNSSAPMDLTKGSILEDYNSPDLGEGYYLRNWNRRIKIVPDIFDLSKLFD